MDDVSHREKKKTETRHAISHAAEKLFIEKGYAATTLQDIASEAGVAQRTIFSYFPSKEAIIFDYHQIFLEEFMHFLEESNDDNIFEAIRRFSDTHKSDSHAYTQCSRNSNVKRLTKQNAVLQEYFSGMLAKLEARFTALIAEKHGFGKDSIEAHLIASSLRTAFQYSIEQNTGDAESSQTGVALRFIEGGIKNVHSTSEKKK